MFNEGSYENLLLHILEALEKTRVAFLFFENCRRESRLKCISEYFKQNIDFLFF